MERTGNAQALAQAGVARWRIALGTALLAALLLFCVALAKPYLQNWKLQTYVEQIAFDPAWRAKPDASIAATVADQAARLGLPVRLEQIRVSKSESGMFIDARYFVRVDLTLYTVDLHFRPSAGVR